MHGVSLLSTVALLTFGFTLTLLLTVIISRMFGHTADATIEVGFGQQLFTLHLNGTRYLIRLIPAFNVTLRTEDSRAVSAGMIVASLVMLLFGMGMTVVLLWNCWETRPIAAPSGFTVLEVKPKGAAARAGITPGLHLLSIDNQPIRTIEPLVKLGKKKEVLLRAAKPGGPSKVYRVDVHPHWYSTREFGMSVTTPPPPARKPASESTLAGLANIVRRGVATAPRFWNDSKAVTYRRGRVHATDAPRITFLITAITVTAWLGLSLVCFSIPMLIHWRLVAPTVALVMLLRPGFLVADVIAVVIALGSQANETAARLAGIAAAILMWFVLSDIATHSVSTALVEYAAETRALGLLWGV